MTVERNITKRWEQGIPHHPKSLELFMGLKQIDTAHGNDYFGWKYGGDGDNGEMLLYELDIYFECQDAGEPPVQRKGNTALPDHS